MLKAHEVFNNIECSSSQLMFSFIMAKYKFQNTEINNVKPLIETHIALFLNKPNLLI